MQHPGNPHVLRVGEFAGELSRQIGALHRRSHDFVVVYVLHRDIWRDLQVPAGPAGLHLHVEALIAEEIAVRNLSRRIAFRADHPVIHSELFSGSI